MIPGLEKRRFATTKIEIRKSKRAGSDVEISQIAGYGAVFNQETVIGNWFRETIMPGAFTPVIGAGADVRSFFNHDENQVLGRTTANTLELREDATGLAYVTDVNPDDPQAVGIAARVARKDVTGSSFSFRVKREEWVEPDEGSAILPLRIIHEFAELYDVGPVTFPAYEGSSSEARSAVQAVLGVDTVPVNVRAALQARLENRSVPKNVSTKKAPTDTPWAAPTLGDFTDKTWDNLAAGERTAIAGHFAWKSGDGFADLHLPHHRAKDGAIVLRGVVAAAGRIDQTAGVDKSAVRSHLEAHYHAFNLKAPWEADASSQRDIDAAITRSETDGEEAAELVGYQSMASLIGQARAGLDAADALVRELIADETETPTEGDDAEAAEEAVERARLTGVLAQCRQVCGAMDSITQLAQAQMTEAPAESNSTSADSTDDDDRLRMLRLAQAEASVSQQGSLR